MIIEGVLTTTAADGTINVAPMGPIVDPAWRILRFRPFQTSQTFANLRASGRGVFHVTDDVELLARAAVGRLEALPPLFAAPDDAGWVIADACRWYAVRVTSIDDSSARAEVQTEVTGSGRLRDFVGFNRAKHAVLEAAIMATRIAILPHAEIQAELRRLAIIVEKTAGQPERRAWDFIAAYINQSLVTDGG